MNNIFNSIKQLEEHIFINKLSETDYEYLVLPIPRGSKPSDTRHSIALLYDGIKYQWTSAVGSNQIQR